MVGAVLAELEEVGFKVPMLAAIVLASRAHSIGCATLAD
jgi:hypothetical protein